MNGYGIISSLGINNHYIICCDPQANCPTFKSKYVDEIHVSPEIRDNESDFINFIIEIGKAHDKKIFLIPTNDTYLSAFHYNWDKLSPYFIPVFETNTNIYENCVDKSKMYQLAASAGVPHPKSFYDSHDIDDSIFPVILKPTIKTAENFNRIPFRIKILNNIDELKVAEQQFSQQNIGYIIQQFIPGDDDQLYTGGIVAIRGKIYGAATGRKIRQYPPSLGVCAYGELIKDEKLANYTRLLIEKSGMTGIAQVEFKKYNGEYYLMEINPRTWLWNSLWTYGGVNLPNIFIKAYYDRSIQATNQTVFKGFYHTARTDFIHNVINNKSISILQFMVDYIKANRYSYGSWKDPLPGIKNITNLFFVNPKVND